MVVNDLPGEECRIAILQDGHLEELYSERAATATNVGNIYKGRVVKVEPAIQAAFVDYGEGQNGFLHVTDLHPRYFPGEERTERVGKRISRRERPLIQEALRSGQEVLVQVMKEGIGTKGPTLTSYLSIPGRLLVMMPDMDRVGVSRKVEDEEERRAMRDILNSLELPPGFGFILRTAGMGRNKTDLKRDVAYLMRLWKIMERRIHNVKAPCELYTESDLLIRTVRDVLRPSIKAIVVDSASAHARASAFLGVVAPRSAPKVTRYRSHAPIFHVFDIERQVELIHSRQVPLPSGGAIVIDQTEALVAIDVNSGRSRSARDSETNAFLTNREAVDEISRQLRLRDLGGLIVNDLIDMRSLKHRRDIEDRFRENLKRDRARTMITRISEFGILEMTRQRMRPSMRKVHYMACPHCEGHGEVKMPESIAADAARQMGFLLQYDRVHRVELVCSPRVASVLLSAKRRELVSLEDATGKVVDVRVSEAIAIDRVNYYAYDERGADIDVSRLPALRIPTIEELQRAEAEAQERGGDAEPRPRGGAHGRDGQDLGPLSGAADASQIALSGEFDDILDEEDDFELDEAEDRDAGREARPPVQPTADGVAARGADEGEGEVEGGGRRRRRRRRRRRGRRGQAGGPVTPLDSQQGESESYSGEHRQGDSADFEADMQAREPGGARTNREEAAEKAAEAVMDAVERIPGSDREPAWTAPAAARDEFSDVDDRDPLAATGDAADAEESSSALSVRIHQLAKQLGVKSREILDKCAEAAGMDVKNHMSYVPAHMVRRIVSWFAPPSRDEPVADPSPQASDGGEQWSESVAEGRLDDTERGAEVRDWDETPEEGQGEGSRDPGAWLESAPSQQEEIAAGQPSPGDSSGEGGLRRRRRRRRGRRGGRVGGASSGPGGAPGPEVAATVRRESPRPSNGAPDGHAGSGGQGQGQGGGRRRRRRRRGGRGRGEGSAAVAGGQDDRSMSGRRDDQSPRPPRESAPSPASEAAPATAVSAAAAKRRRTLYRNRTRISAAAREQAEKLE